MRQVIDLENFLTDSDNAAFYIHMLSLEICLETGIFTAPSKLFYRSKGCALLCISVRVIQDKDLETIIKLAVAVRAVK